MVYSLLFYYVYVNPFNTLTISRLQPSDRRHFIKQLHWTHQQQLLELGRGLVSLNFSRNSIHVGVVTFGSSLWELDLPHNLIYRTMACSTTLYRAVKVSPTSICLTTSWVVSLSHRYVLGGKFSGESTHTSICSRVCGEHRDPNREQAKTHKFYVKIQFGKTTRRGRIHYFQEVTVNSTELILYLHSGYTMVVILG